MIAVMVALVLLVTLKALLALVPWYAAEVVEYKLDF